MLTGFNNLAQLKIPLAGELHGKGDGVFNHIGTDSRTLQKGDLFLAIRGARYDGHNFIRDARAKGAAAFIVSQEIGDDMPNLLVKDTTRALGHLGTINRLKWQGTLVAITGSNGKTTVKEMIGVLLARQGKTLITPANENNNFGVPMTLLRLNESYQYAVIEIGADKPGEIDYSSQLAKPQIAVLTNAHPSHLGGFGTTENIAAEKGQLIAHTVANGTVILGGDAACVSLWTEKAKGKKIILFSAAQSDAAFRVDDFRQETAGIRFRLSSNEQGETELFLPLFGRHNALNAAAACAVGHTLGMEVSLMREILAQFTPPRGRLYPIPLAQDSLLLDDSYNANPTSAAEALRVLSELPWQGKKIAVFGDMLDLGDRAKEEHEFLGQVAEDAGLDGILCCGDHASLVVREVRHIPLRRAFRAKKDLLSFLSKENWTQTLFLVKGSRSMRMEEVVNFLRTHLGEN